MLPPSDVGARLISLTTLEFRRREHLCKIDRRELLSCHGCGKVEGRREDFPLPEHPRPDFQRADWINVNESRVFRFDKKNAGLASVSDAIRAAWRLCSS